MLNDSFIQLASDFFGGWTLEEFADYLNLTTEELFAEIEFLLDEHLEEVREAMGYEEIKTEEEEVDED